VKDDKFASSAVLGSLSLHVKSIRVLLACNPLWTPEEAPDQACVRSRSRAAEGALQNIAQEVILRHTFLRHCICQDAERAELLTLYQTQFVRFTADQTEAG